ncbi:vWA domain-containing protein [Salaquimonas pukyongi]|uniref:vWA domain-containing protein n=1 Tax=Salaquimonas pukyongi TaxID=2712698 RepID=UPI00096B8512|nr:VWA domain-containing protein [Salaquimonas pukyongi]
MLTRIVLAVFLSLFAITSLARAADENVIVVLDASGSMWGRIDDKPKIQIAREVMDQVLGDLDGKAEIGIMTYGHRKKGDCGDIETLIPVGKVERARYMEKINALNPKGKTPITAAVRKAAEELRFTEEKATVILVSDGLETCDADPCALASELESAGIDFTAHVVGFDLKDEDTASLQCLATTTGGKYLAAESADQLGEAIGTVVAAAPEPEPEPEPKPEPEPATGPGNVKITVRLAEGSEPLKGAYLRFYETDDAGAKGKEAGQGAARHTFELAPGKYLVSTKVGAAPGSTVVDVEAAAALEADIILNAGLLSVKATEKEGGEPNPKAYIYVHEPEEKADGSRDRITGANQRQLFTLPTGRYYATATLGETTKGTEVEIKPGERTDVTLVLGAGVLKVDVLAMEGGKPLDDGYIHVYEPEMSADGKRKKVANGNQRTQFSIPAGTYYVTGQVGKAVAGREIEVKPGERTEASIIIDMGMLQASAIPAEGGKPFKDAYITVYEAEKALDGSRNRVEGGNQRNRFALPAGKYVVHAKMDNATAEAEVEVKAGSLAEPVLNLQAGALLVDASKEVYVSVFEAEKSLDGTRTHVDSFRPNGKPVIIPAGKYVLSGKTGDKVAEAEVEVTAGKLTEVKLAP